MSRQESKTGPSFFKILKGDFSQRLRIPPAFVKHIVMDASQRAILKAPSGRIWHVQLCRSVTGTYLQDGWKKFAEDHSLEDSDFLLFRFDGNMHFTVRIFNKSACEKEEVVTCNTCREFTFCSGSKMHGSLKKTPLDFKHHSQHKLYGSDKKNHQSDYIHSLRTSQCNNIDSTQRQQMPAQKIYRFKRTKTEDVDLFTFESNSYSMRVGQNSQRQQSTTEEKTKAFENANSFSKASKFPNFICSVGKGLIVSVPNSFSKEHLPKERTTIFLWDPKGRAWEVTFIFRYPGSCKLSGGWPAFSRSNDLAIGDICVFELVGKFQMQVHIFSLKTLSSPVKISKESQHMPAPNINRFKKIRTEDVKLPMSETNFHSIGADHILERWPLTTEEQRKVFEKAKSFSKASQFPHFLVVMNSNSVDRPFIMYIPACFSREHLPKEKRTFIFRDPKGRTWAVNLMYRQSRGHRVSGGWAAFSRGNDLKKRDICIFELVGNCQMQVHIFPLKTSFLPDKASKETKLRNSASHD